MKPTHALAGLLCMTAAVTSCSDSAGNRIPPAPVRITFFTVGDWTTYGVTGATDYVYFTREPRQPADFPFTAITETGWGGVVLVSDILGQPRAYDMSCPVEAKRDVRIRVDQAKAIAICDKCGSTYSIFELGSALSGPAAADGWGLQAYTVRMPGPAGEYAVITQ